MKKILCIVLCMISLFGNTVYASTETATCYVTVDAYDVLYKKEIRQEEKLPAFSFDNSLEEIISIVATKEDVEKIKTEGLVLTARVEVKSADYENTVVKNSKIKELEDTYTGHICMDITLNKVFSRDKDGLDIVESTSLSELNDVITLSFEVPKEYDPDKQSIKYTLIRIHDGQIEELDIKPDSNNKYLTFNTDKFSTYIFYYEITNLPVKEMPDEEKKGSNSNDNNSSEEKKKTDLEIKESVITPSVEIVPVPAKKSQITVETVSEGIEETTKEENVPENIVQKEEIQEEPIKQPGKEVETEDSHYNTELGILFIIIIVIIAVVLSYSAYKKIRKNN